VDHWDNNQSCKFATILSPVTAQKLTFLKVVYFCAMAYFVFKLVRMWDSSRSADYLSARKTLTAFAAMTIVLLIVTIGVCVRCALNYGHGLKNHTVARNNSVTESTLKPEYYMDPYNQQPQNEPYGRPSPGARMEID
jgi:hypothetical protein